MAGIEDLKGRLISKNGMALANQFSVELPTTIGKDPSTQTKLSGISAKTANILCKSVTMPGKQIMTVDRQIGIYNEKVVNGFAVEDVTMTFYVLNDYGIKKYFDNWRKVMIGEANLGDKLKGVDRNTEGEAPTAEEAERISRSEKEIQDGHTIDQGAVGYKNDYSGVVKIHQMRKPIMRTGFDLGPISIDFDLLGGSIYSVELIEAFPTTISAIELSNEPDGLVEISVQFSYTNWKVIKDERGLFKPNISLGSIF